MHILAYFIHIAVTIAGVVAIYWLSANNLLPNGIRPRADAPKWMLPVGAFAVIAFVLASLRLTSPPIDPFWDFYFAYYPAGNAILTDDLSALRTLIGKGVQGFVNIPVVAYLFAPFAVFSPKIASLVFSAVGLGLAIYSWFTLARLANLKMRENWILAWLFLANGPLLNTFKLGNSSEFILAALVAGLGFLHSRRPVTAGAVLGAAAVVKLPLVLFAAFFLARRDYRGLVSFSVTGMAAAFLSLAIFGWAENWNWFETTILKYSGNWFSVFSVQTISGFVMRLPFGANLNEFTPAIPTLGQKVLANSIMAALFAMAAIACWRPQANDAGPDSVEVANQRRNLQFMLVVCLCLVASPLSWSHYYCWLLMPAAFFLGSETFPPSAWAHRVGWAAILLAAPLVMLPWSSENWLLMTAYRTIAISHYVIAGVLWIGLISWSLARTGGWLTEKPSEQPKNRKLTPVF